MKLLKLYLLIALVLCCNGIVFSQYTDDLCTGGTATASSEFESNVAANAFDDNTTAGVTGTYWASGDGSMPEWLQYDFGAGNAKTIVRYRFMPDQDDLYIPEDWQFQGSNNAADWTPLDTKTGQTLSQDTWYTWDFVNSTAYRYYRLYITNTRTNENYADIKEMEMMELQSATVTFTDGSAFIPAVTPGNANQVIGRFQLTGNIAGASLTAASIKLNGTRTGLSNLKLWGSTDATFNSGSDTQLGSTVAADPGDGNSASFSGFSSAIATGGTYYFLTGDVSAEATGVVQGVIVANANLTLANGTLTGTITNAPLSNGDASLPVELASFTANVQGNTIVLNWQTASETNNLGFILEREEGNGEWQPLASYKTDAALKGQGNSSTTTTYTYSDNNVSAGAEYRYRLGDVNVAGVVTMHSPISVTTTALPQSTAMLNAYPNPFNPETTINYELHKDTQVTITVYDLLGRQVKTLIDEQQAAGSYRAIWNGTDAVGAQAASGAYIMRMQTQQGTQTQKVLFIK